MSFDKRIKSLRIENNLTQKQFANKINVTKSSISMYERGMRTPPLEKLEEIADFFNVDMDYLIGNTNIKNRYKEDYPKNEPLKDKDKIINLVENLSEDNQKRLLDMILLFQALQDNDK